MLCRVVSLGMGYKCVRDYKDFQLEHGGQGIDRGHGGQTLGQP